MKQVYRMSRAKEFVHQQLDVEHSQEDFFHTLSVEIKKWRRREEKARSRHGRYGKNATGEQGR